jgi:hypothetical protein
MKCADCGKPYGQGENVVVDSEDWERIADDGAYLLCFDCMDRRCAERGMYVKCDITRIGTALSTRIPHPVWRSEETVKQSSIGHPALYRNR